MDERERILVIDGDRSFRASLTLILKEKGFETETAETGRKALRKAQETFFNLAILDLGLPDMDGVELLALLKEIQPDVELIVVTDLASLETAVQSLNEGASAYITKPLNMNVVLPTIRQVLEKQRLAQEKRRSEEALHRSLEATARSQRLLLALSQAAQAAQCARAPDEVYKTIRDQIASLGYHATISTLTDDQAQLIASHLPCDSALLRAAEDLTSISAYDCRIPLVPGGFYSRIVDGGEPVFIDPDTSAFAKAPPGSLHATSDRQAHFLGVEKAIYVPLKVGGETHSLLTILGADLTEADVPAMAMFASQAGIAIENAQLFAKARQRADELAMLYEIGQALASTLDLEEVLRTTMRRAIEALRGEAGSILWLDAETGELEFVALGGTDAEDLKGRRIPPGKGVAGWVAQSGQTAIVSDTSTDPRFYPSVDTSTGFVTRSILAVPLWRKNEIVGVMEVLNKVEGHFDEGDARLLQSLASSAAMAVENARLYESAQQEIGERKRAEEALRDNQIRYHSLFENSPIALLEEDFSGVKRIIDALRESGISDFRAYFEDHPEAVARCANAVRITDINQAALRLCKARSKEDLEWGLGVIFTGDSLDVFREELVALAQGSTQFERETVQRTLRDDELYLTVKLAVAPGYEETWSKVFVSIIDITERKQAEQTLRESEERYRMLVEHMPIGLYRSTPGAKGRLLMANPAFLSMFGFDSAGDLQEVSAADLYAAPGERKVFSDNLMAQKRISGAEVRLRRRDGTLLWGSITARVIHDERGEPAYFDCTIEDVTERVQAERELQQYTERLRALHEIDAAILANWSAEAIAKAALRHMQQLVPYWRASAVMFDHDKCEATVLATDGDGVTRLGAGTSLPLDRIGGLEELERGEAVMIQDIQALAQPSAVAQALYSESLRSYITVPLVTRGELIGFLNLGADKPHVFIPEHVDIAQEVANQLAVGLRQARLQEEVQRHVAKLEQRVAERTAELSSANAALARASHLKDEFLASMSHELRTPLNAILGLSEALQEEVYGPLNEHQLKSLGTIEESGRHLLALINDILDVSKIEAGKVELDIAPVLVEPVCRASLELIKQSAHKKHLRTSFSIDDVLTAIQADERRLKQILVNLLSNAVKFTPEEGEIGLEAVGDRERGVAHFTVWDTGVGIPQEDMARLFQPFVQLDSSLSREYTGTGLGLALVQGLAELHGGGVSLESEVGKGSRFTVSLPWQPVDSIQSPMTSKQYSVTSERDGLTSDHRSPITILLAEDNESSIRTITDYLLTRGYRLIVAHDGVEAVEQAREEQPDLILMDIQMPRMDGLEATKRLRADASLAEVPIIALTAAAMPGDRERCLEAGVDEYLSKPVSLKELANVIKTHLGVCTEA